MHMVRHEHASDRAFTLVELLVVVGIIALLISILIPVLGRARTQAKATAELAATRQLMFAYLNYTNENRGWLIDGRIATSITLTDDLNKPLSPAEAGKRWPWRLVYDLQKKIYGTLFVGDQAEAMRDRTVPLWNYMVSLQPSFGLNLHGLGGDAEGGITTANPQGCTFKIAAARHDSRLIVFCSARSNSGVTYVPGYFKVVPPTQSFEFSASGWSAAQYDERVDPGTWGYVHARYFGDAVVACLDGHSELIPFNDLRDMTRWTEPAAATGNSNWKFAP